jgi:PAS domain S-box-containing protein
LLGKLTVEYSPHDEEAANVDANDLKVMASGRSLVADEEYTDSSGQKRLFRSTKTPLRDPEGNVIGLAGISIDVTEERSAMAALRASEERFRTLSETVPAFIFITNDKGEITYTNGAFQNYTGMSDAELSGMGWARAIHRDDRSIPQAAWDEAAASNKAYAAEYRFRNRDGEYRWFMCRATAVRNAEDMQRCAGCHRRAPEFANDERKS